MSECLYKTGIEKSEACKVWKKQDGWICTEHYRSLKKQNNLPSQMSLWINNTVMKSQLSWAKF